MNNLFVRYSINKKDNIRVAEREIYSMHIMLTIIISCHLDIVLNLVVWLNCSSIKIGLVHIKFNNQNIYSSHIIHVTIIYCSLDIILNIVITYIKLCQIRFIILNFSHNNFLLHVEYRLLDRLSYRYSQTEGVKLYIDLLIDT